jgi:hypothetical protein
MRNLLALLGAAAVAFIAVGWYLDWYKVRTTPTASGHREVNIDFNGPKIKDDLSKGEQKLRGVLQGSGKKAPENAVQSVTPAEPVPSPLPPGMPAIPVAMPGVPPGTVPGVNVSRPANSTVPTGTVEDVPSVPWE